MKLKLKSALDYCPRSIGRTRLNGIGMTGHIERKRTDLNKELSDYFRKLNFHYTGSFEENEGEEILYSINGNT
nr:hypothetical protein [Bacillus velezensis]